MDYIEVRTETTHDAAELLAELLAEITGGAQVDDPQTIEDFVNAPVKRWDYIEEQLFDNPQRNPSVNCYLPPDEEGARMLREMGELLAQLKKQDETGFYGSLKMDVSQVRARTGRITGSSITSPLTWVTVCMSAPAGSRLICPRVVCC